MKKLFTKVLLVILFLSITGCVTTLGGINTGGFTKCEHKSRVTERWHHFFLNLHYNMTKDEVNSFVGFPSHHHTIVIAEGESEYEQWIYKCQYKVGKRRFILERHLLFKDGKLIYW